MSNNKKLNIEFDILDTKNPFFMSVVDLSNWALLKDRTSNILVTLPGYSTPVQNYFDKNSINVLNAFNLGIICADDCADMDYVAIPDGIYCITVESSCATHSATKMFLRTTLIELELDQIIINKIKSENITNFQIDNDITKIEFLLKAAKANTRYDNINEAQQLFSIATTLIDKIKRCCN